MPDDGDGLSSEDLIRQARERLQADRSDSSSGDSAPPSAGDSSPSESAMSADSISEELARQAAEDAARSESSSETGSEFTREELEAMITSSRSHEPPPFEPDTRRHDPDADFDLGPGPVEYIEGDEPGGFTVGPETEEAPPRKTRRWPAILAIVFGVLVAIGIFFDDSKPATDLEVGDCLLEPSGDEFSSVTIIECDEPHDYEIFAVTALPGGDYPGDFEILDSAYQRCIPLFDAYVGSDYETSIWFIDVFVPGEDLWNDGNRSVRCAVYQPDESFENIIQVSGSARNAGN